MGAAGSEAGHGATASQYGTDAEEEGDETPQRALPAQIHNGGKDEAKLPPERLRALNVCGRQGGEGGGRTPTQKREPTARSGGTGGTPEHNSTGPPLRDREQEPEGGNHRALRV